MRVVFENLTKRQAEVLVDWFEGQGEQDCVPWFEDRGVKAPFVDVGAGKNKWKRVEGDDIIVLLKTV